jgi:F0F1-type ATP synthase epsilon subunit
MVVAQPGGGRFRVTDDSVVTIGTDVPVRAEHIDALNATKAKESSDATRKS